MQIPISYEFGPFRFSPAKHKLLKNEIEVKGFQTRTSEVLQVLIESRERRITTQEFLAKVWGNRNPVASGSLYYQIHLLRQILEDDKDNPIYIDVKKKEGIQFIANVRELPQDTDLRVSETRAQVLPTLTLPSYSAKLRLSFGDHFWHVVANCVIYASHYMITILLEVAYRFDIYGTKAMIAAPIFFCWILITSVWGLAVASKAALKGKGYGLALAVVVFVAAAMVAFLGAWFVLPHTSVTEAKFQTLAAPAAYLKDIAYILPIALLYLIVPFHFVSVLEQEIEQGKTKEIFELLSGSKLSIRPVGTIYIKIWVLGLLLAGWLAYSLAGRAHLFDNLLPSPYLVMFEVFHQTRTILQFALGLYCMAWYYWTLNRLKSKYLVR